MALNFSNESRSYDATRLAVRFWGYDGSQEVSFFVTEDALRMLAGDRVIAEAECLAAFDAHRSAIYKAAGTVYGRGRKGSYEVGAKGSLSRVPACCAGFFSGRNHLYLPHPVPKVEGWRDISKKQRNSLVPENFPNLPPPPPPPSEEDGGCLRQGRMI